MVHQRECLPLGLEAGDDVARVHSRLDDLQRDLAAHGMLLLGDEHEAHAPLADLLHQLVGADHRAGSFGDCLVILGRIRGKRPAHECAGFAVIPEQAFDLGPQASVVPHASSRNAARAAGDAISRARPNIDFASGGVVFIGLSPFGVALPSMRRAGSETARKRENQSWPCSGRASPSRQRNSQARA